MKHLSQIIRAGAGRPVSAMLFAGILLGALPLMAQLPSNASLQGAYYVRYLMAFDSGVVASFQGIMTFDGNGGFQLNGQGTNAYTGNPLQFDSSGQYFTQSSGLMTMGNPFASGASPVLSVGIGTGGVLVGGTTGNNDRSDLFMAIPVSSASSNATLKGAYHVAGIEFSNSDLSLSRSTFFSVTADGKGGLGTVSVAGTAQSLNSVPTLQTSAGATYSVKADGSATWNLPPPAGVAANNQLLAGDRTLYVSKDGSFFMGGSPSGYDAIVGVQAFTGTASTDSFQGLYFRAFLENSAAGTSNDGMHSGFGSANEVASEKLEIAHTQLHHSGNYSLPLDGTFSTNLPLKADGTMTAPGTSFALGAGGNIAIDTGGGADYLLGLRVKVPALTGSGVFLSPAGVVNAASNAPFTAPVAPGEFISLYGSGLASGTATASSLPFPTSLGGVQVTITGGDGQQTLAPLYYVSPTSIAAVVPYSVATGGWTPPTVQVTNGGNASNVVRIPMGPTAPGVFTVPSGGVGNAAALDSSYRLLSSTNPAKPGDTVQIFLTGLGPVDPPVTAGSAAPRAPLSTLLNTSAGSPVRVRIGGLDATVVYAGLAPNLGGLYQLNVTVPNGVPAGDADLDIDTLVVNPALGADHSQFGMATIPIAK